MSKLFGLTLGILTALGGFVDIGELVFATQAGAQFGYSLLWPILVGVVTIIFYSEMCGRVAIVSKKPVYVLIRERLGFTLGLSTMLASQAVNILTCAAEIGGVAFVLRLLSSIPYGLAVAVATFGLIAVVMILRFNVIEKVFGLGGLAMLVFAAAAFVLKPDWGQVVAGAVPNIPTGMAGDDLLTYGYFAVGLIGATVMPYEVFFYSSGNIEEEKGPQDLRMNSVITAFGFGFGSIVTLSLIVLGAQLFLPSGITPQLVGSSLVGAYTAFGRIGLLVGILGILFAIGGAVIETSLSGGYGIAQFFGLEWGKNEASSRRPRFTLSWLLIFGLALLILATGVDPIAVTEYAVIFSVVVLPLTYLPILLVANDEKVMGEHVNTRFQTIFAAVLFVLIVVVAIAAPVLMYVSRMGQAGG